MSGLVEEETLPELLTPSPFASGGVLGVQALDGLGDRLYAYLSVEISNLNCPARVLIPSPFASRA
jgi:hypothetical protein